MSRFDRIVPVTGGSTTRGWAYHNIPGVPGPSHRDDTQARVDHITDHFDPDGLRGVDLGCSVGGISFGLAARGATMRGYDHDYAAIHTARVTRDELRADCTFVTGDLTDPVTWDAVFDDHPEFVVWLSNWMWIAKAAGEQFARDRLTDLWCNVDTLIFETAQGGVSMAGSAGCDTAADVHRLLTDTTDYEIDPLGPTPGDRWHNRSVFLCTKG